MKPMNANELLAGLALARPVPITAVVTDSRKVQPGCIFVCFPGERVDGHDYAAKAYQAGAEYVIANHPVEYKDGRDMESYTEFYYKKTLKVPPRTAIVLVAE